VQAAVLAAQEAAQDAAETRVVAPQRSAARVVAVRPVSASSVDYAGLAQEAARISEQIREVYAQALQRELIARLVREQIDEDEDDSVLLLFG
jgi:predicted ATP-grasp superfamily ATP-dependent carboligase